MPPGAFLKQCQPGGITFFQRPAPHRWAVSL